MLRTWLFGFAFVLAYAGQARAAATTAQVFARIELPARVIEMPRGDGRIAYRVSNTEALVVRGGARRGDVVTPTETRILFEYQ